MATQVVLNKFRLSVDANSTLDGLTAKDVDWKSALSANVRIGISDLNGILYWGGRAIF